MSVQQSSELVRFHEFIAAKLGNGQADISPEEALYDWRAENPTREEYAASVAAIRESLADMEAGDCGRPAADVMADLRRKYNIPVDE